MRRFLTLFFAGFVVGLPFAPLAKAQEKKAETPIGKDAFGDPLPVGAIARIGTTRYRLPNARLRSQLGRLSPDGKLLAVAGSRNEIEIWELPAWKLQRVIQGPNTDDENPPQFSGLTFSADSTKLAAFQRNENCVFLFDLATGKSVKKLVLGKKNSLATLSLTLARGQQTLVVSFGAVHEGKDLGQQVQTWSLANEKMTKSFQIPMSSAGWPPLAISANGRWLARSSPDDDLRQHKPKEFRIEIWEIATGKLARHIDTELPIRCAAFSPDGKWLAVAYGQSILRIYETASGQERHNIRIRQGTINDLAFSPDSLSLYAINNRGQITGWNAVKGERLATYQSPSGIVAEQLSFQPDGKMLALSLFANAVHFWEVTTGKILSPTGVPTSRIRDVAFSPSGELFVSSRDSTLAWWNPRTGVKLRDVKLDFALSRDFEGRFSIDGTVHHLRDVKVNLADFENRVSIEGAFYYVEPHGSSVTMSPTGEYFTEFDGGSDVSITFFDGKTGKLLYDEDGGPGGKMRWVSFFDADRKVASILHKKVRTWDSRTGRDLSHFTIPLREREEAVRFAVSPNGKYFAFRTAKGKVNRVLLWDAELQNIVHESPAARHGNETLTFSPNNQWLAIAGGEDNMKLSRLGFMKVETVVNPRNSEISQITFSPDSRQLACAAIYDVRDLASSRILIYEMVTKQIRLELAGHAEGIIERLAYSHDGALLASGSTDATALVWNAGLRGFAATPAKQDATAAELAEWFQQMAGADAKTSFQGMIKLVQTPKQAVRLFEAKIVVPKKPDASAKTTAQQIDDLGSGQFPVRSKATAILKKLGGSAEPELRAALSKAKDIEMKRRIEELLERIASH